MTRINFDAIKPFIDDDAIILGNKNFTITNVQTADNINNESLDWINPIRREKKSYAKMSKAPVVLCEIGLDLEKVDLTNKCFIQVRNPKLTFIRIASHFFLNRQLKGIHKRSIIHLDAEIDESSYIGPNTYIGKCKVGKNSIIYGNCFIYDNCTIGDNVIIHSGTVIGADGFGYQRNDLGVFEKFPHIGGVEIGNDVEIGSNTSIDRGALGNTIIKDGVKIDNLVHIAHNVIIGKHTAITAHSMIGGSTIVGDYCWIAPLAALRDQISIGDHVTIGMGAIVTKNIGEGETWTGSPAKPLKDFIDLQKRLKQI